MKILIIPMRFFLLIIFELSSCLVASYGQNQFNKDTTSISSHVSTSQDRLIINNNKSPVRDVTFSPDGQLLASCSTDKTIIIWDMATGLELRTLEGHTAEIYTVSFSPDGLLLASGSNDNTIKLWEVLTGRELFTLTGHTRSVTDIDFSPDGHLLASGSIDKTIKLWDVSTGDCIRTIEGHNAEIYAVSFSPDSLLLASGGEDNIIKLWELSSGRELNMLKGHTRSNIPAGKLSSVLAGVTALDFSPDGKLLASGSEDNTIKLWDVATGVELCTLKGHVTGEFFVTFGSKKMPLVFFGIPTIAFSPDGKWLATGGMDSTIRIWELPQCYQFRILIGHTESVFSLAFSPNGTWLCSGSVDKNIKLWKTERWRYK